MELDRLHEIQIEVAGGTTAVVGLVYKGNLYVANVGDSRALLCTSDSTGSLYVQNVTVDHNIKNPNEVARLANIGLNVEQLMRGNRIGGLEHTRSIGDYALKGGYKDFDIIRYFCIGHCCCSKFKLFSYLFSMASSEPVIADPHVVGPIPLGESVSFLVLMSDGVYNALEEASNCPDVNMEIARLVSDELFCNSSVTSAAQAVVDKICRLHYEYFMEERGVISERGDMTLLIRNFHHGLKCRTYSSASTNSNSSRDTIDLSRTPQGGGYFQPVTVPYSETNPSNTSPSLYIPDSRFQSGSGLCPTMRLVPVGSSQYTSPSPVSASTLYSDDPFTIYSPGRRDNPSQLETPLMVPTCAYPAAARQTSYGDCNIKPSRSDTFQSTYDRESNGRRRATSSGPVLHPSGRTLGDVDQARASPVHFIKGHRRVPSDPSCVAKSSPKPPHRKLTYPVAEQSAISSRGMQRHISFPFVTAAASTWSRKKPDRERVQEISEECGGLPRQRSDPLIAVSSSRQSALSPTPCRSQTPGLDCMTSDTSKIQSRTSTPLSGMSPYHTPPSPPNQAVQGKPTGMGGSVDSGISNMEESDPEQRQTVDTAAEVNVVSHTISCRPENEGTVQDTKTITREVNKENESVPSQTEREESPDTSGRIVSYLDFSGISLPDELSRFFDGHCQ